MDVLTTFVVTREQRKVPLSAAFSVRVRDDTRGDGRDRKSTRLNSSHLVISYAVFCLKKKTHRSSFQRQLVTRALTHVVAPDLLQLVIHADDCDPQSADREADFCYASATDISSADSTI